VTITPADAADTGPAPTAVTVHPDQTLATVPAGAIGVSEIGNLDGHLHAPGTDALLDAAGVGLRALDNGAWSDVYRWQTNSFDYDPITAHTTGQNDPGNSWQAYLGEVRKSGSAALIHVNYGSTATDGPGGSDIGPQEAAAWVRQANLVDHDNIKYWEIGEEVYGNGFYSSFGAPTWEPDHHADKSPAAYGANVAKFAQAMKAVDPSIQIGVGLSMYSGPGVPDWNDPVLTAAGSAVDFVDLHWYEGTTTRDDSALLQSNRSINTTLDTVRQQITTADGARANKVKLIIGETNVAGANPNRQSVSTVSALYAADEITSQLEDGASSVDWFASHVAIQPDAVGAADDPTGVGYGDYGMLSAGECGPDALGAQVCEPKVNTPFPAYYGVTLASRIATPGARLVSTSVGAGSSVVAHAAVQRNGDLVVLLENQNADQEQQATIDYSGYRVGPVAEIYSYGQNSTSIARRSGRSGSVALPPYSLTELVLHRG
ncbi:MAG TPA: hypothetical protein VHW44_30680, partial [Pseudonocardiaceae bacterium]|nr:hypothetical protein [Pseudonocardiaceae bacterium]